MPTTIQQTHKLAEKLGLEIEGSDTENLARHASAIIENELDRIIQEWEAEVERVRAEAYEEGLDKGREEALNPE